MECNGWNSNGEVLHNEFGTSVISDITRKKTFGITKNQNNDEEKKSGQSGRKYVGNPN